MLVIFVTLTLIVIILSSLIIYTIILRMGEDYYRPMSNEQIREQKILRGLYKREDY